MLPVLAISGKRFSGKDTFAAQLVGHASRLGHDLPVYAFAAESKRMFAAREPEVALERLLHDREYKETWRPRLTQFTVDALAADPQVFVREVARRIEEAGVPALISDLRLHLEVAELRPRFDLRVVRLVRSDPAREASGWRWKDGVDDHHTETELDDPSVWDQRVDNEGSVDDLSGRAEALVTAWFGQRSDR